MSVLSGATGCSTDNRPPTDSRQSFDHSFAHSAPGNPHGTIMPIFTQPTYGRGSTVNSYVQATHDGYPDHENVQHEIERYEVLKLH